MGEAKELSRFELFLVNFCVIDTLFLTYLPFVALSFSVPLTVLWFFYRNNRKTYEFDREWNRYLSFVVFVIVALVIAGIFVQDAIEQSLKTSIELLLTFNLFFVFKDYLKYVKIDRYLCCFIYFGAILALVYFVNRGLFLQLKMVINPYDGDGATYLYGLNPLSQFRYNFLWTDANNPAYLFPAVLYLLFSLSDYSLLKKTVLFLCTGFVVIATMSKGGLISFVVVSLLYIISKKKRISFVVKKSDVLAIAFIILTFIALTPYIREFFTSNETILQSFDRVQNNVSGSESRIAIWIKFLTNKPLWHYILCGEGPIHIIYGKLSQPHNGFLYLIYGYGFVGAIQFIRLVLIPKDRVWRCPYYFPIYFGFFVNTLITNPKILGLLFIIRICSDPNFDFLGDTREHRFFEKEAC